MRAISLTNDAAPADEARRGGAAASVKAAVGAVRAASATSLARSMVGCRQVWPRRLRFWFETSLIDVLFEKLLR